MTEITFAKSFLATLDSYPSRLSPEHVENPKNHPARPLFTLPKSTRPIPSKRKLHHVASPDINVHLKSLRNPPIDHTLTSLSPTTSILEIKEMLSAFTNISIKKIRLLFNKKPVAESHAIKSLLGESGCSGGATLELSVVVIGGAVPLNVSMAPDEKSEESVREHEKIIPLVQTDSFWLDLKKFLIKRLASQDTGEETWKVFRAAYDAEELSK